MKLYWPVRVEDGAFRGQLFGQNLVPYPGMKGHNGIDFPAPRGTPIYVAHDGWIIEQTAKDTGFGLRIGQRVEADGKFYLFVYGHMLRLERDFNVPYDWNRKDIFVRAGEVIGYVDSTGYSTGDHLHFGIYENTQEGIRINADNGYGGAIDPEPYLAHESEKPTMSNVQLVKKGSEFGFYLPANSEDALIDKADNFGYPLPKTPDGKKVDWAKVKPEIEINA